MLDPGATAPTFSLPGVEAGDIDTFALEDYLDGVVVLAFYPMDFSPSCTDELCAIREAELFAIADHVRLLAIGGDSVYAHRAFADRHDLAFPLLTDRLGDVAEAYGVLHEELDGHDRLPKRAVFVVDNHRTVRYAWATDDPTMLPQVDDVAEAIQSISDDVLALDQYEHAHSPFTYGTAELSRAEEAYDEEDWSLAVETFSEAEYYLQRAEDGFEQAARYADTDAVDDAATTATGNARRLRQAANWFRRAAEEYARGALDDAAAIETDARETLSEARDFPDVQPPAAIDPSTHAAEPTE